MWKRNIRIASIVSIVILLSFFATTVLAHQAAIEISGENDYKAIRLTPPIYNAANSDLSDLWLKDSQGENVPYFIRTGFQKTYKNREVYGMELIDSYTKDSSFYFDYKIADERSDDTVATSIELTTANTNFAKAVALYGSYDNSHWEFVQSDTLYAIDGREKLRIAFNQPQKFTHYRFKLENNLEKISFAAVSLVYDMATSEEVYFIENFRPTFRVEEKDNRTYIEIDGLKNLRLCDLTLESDSMFKRMVSAPSGVSKELYQLSLNGIAYTDMTIPLGWQLSREDRYVVTIVNNDDKPIHIDGITVRYYADEVVFAGNTAASYTLEFGAAETAAAPVYDIASYADEVLKGAIDTVTVGEITVDATEEAPPEPDYSLVFNGVVVVVALLLGGVILLRLRRKG